MRTPGDVDEWAESDRVKELERIRRESAEQFITRNNWKEDLGKLFTDYLVMMEGLRECTRRYLDATGRGAYGQPTFDSEFDLFKRIGENVVIARSLPREKN